MNEYSLATQPWLPVLDHRNYTLKHVSLGEAFTEARVFTVTTGMTLMDQAVHRLLLAITYAALPPLGDTNAYSNQVREGLDYDSVLEWLQDHQSDFDLLHPDTPFGQDPHVRQEPGTVPVRVASLDPRVANQRPLLSDHRTLNDTGTVDLSQTALLLLLTQAYGAAGKRPGQTKSLKSTALVGRRTWRPTGTIDTALRWARTPDTGDNTVAWTFTDRNDSTPRGAADGLHWLGRRIALDVDAESQAVTQTWLAGGWLPPVLDDPADTTPGFTDLIARAVDAPLDLFEAWHNASQGSLAATVRNTLQKHDVQAPAFAATSHLINKGKNEAATQTMLPPRVLGLSEDHATEIAEILREARKEAARFFRGSSRTVMAAIEADLLDDPRFVDEPTLVKAMQRAAQAGVTPAPTTPVTETVRRTTSLWSPKQTAQVSDDDPDGLFFTPVDPEDLFGDLNHLRDVFHALRVDPDLAERYATLGQARLPETLVDLGVPDRDATPTLRLMAVLIGTWLNRRPQRLDGSRPLATVMRWNRRDTYAALITAITSGPALSARASLIEVIESLPLTTAPSWSALYDDLCTWDRVIRTAWRTDYFTKSTNITTERTSA